MSSLTIALPRGQTENFDWAFDYAVTSVEKDVQISTDAQYLTAFDVDSLCHKPENADSGTAETPAALPQQ